ncbi:MAG: hypothetical protein AAF548_10610 [Actinomycetota bacterium]
MLERLRAEPERLVHWTLAVVWVATFFLLGPALSDAFDGWDHVDWIPQIAIQAVWFIGVLICLALPAPMTLTIIRIAVPATVPVAIWASIETDDTAAIAMALVGTILSTALALSSPVGDRFIDGASYGDERRFALRPPGPVLVGLLLPTWAVAVVGALSGPVLLADRRWVIGAIAVVLGWALTFFAGRMLNNLTDRFVVFVPTGGLVVHDLNVMAQPVLFQRREIAGIGPALADTTAADMTNAALGLALELKFASAIALPVITGRAQSEEQDLRSILISPSRPASLLRVAQARDLPIA